MHVKQEAALMALACQEFANARQAGARAVDAQQLAVPLAQALKMTAVETPEAAQLRQQHVQEVRFAIAIVVVRRIVLVLPAHVREVPAVMVAGEHVQELRHWLMVPVLHGDLVVQRVKTQQVHKHVLPQQHHSVEDLRRWEQRSHVMVMVLQLMVPVLLGELVVLHVETGHKHVQFPHLNAEVLRLQE